MLDGSVFSSDAAATLDREDTRSQVPEWSCVELESYEHGASFEAKGFLSSCN